MELHRLAAKEAARRIERGELKAKDLLRSCLERIAAREKDVQAWTFIAKEFPALDEPHGPLFGVPVGVKDIFDTHDMPSEYGSPIYAGHRPKADAAIVALTRRAGGAILGKTGTAEVATFVPRGTRHPHNLAHTPGGFSSGAAAALGGVQVAGALRA